jgi:hypothetical protein
MGREGISDRTGLKPIMVMMLEQETVPDQNVSSPREHCSHITEFINAVGF